MYTRALCMTLPGEALTSHLSYLLIHVHLFTYKWLKKQQLPTAIAVIRLALMEQSITIIYWHTTHLDPVINSVHYPREEPIIDGLT